MHLYTTRTGGEKKGAYCYNCLCVPKNWHLTFCVRTDACVLYCELYWDVWSISCASYHRNVNCSGLQKKPCRLVLYSHNASLCLMHWPLSLRIGNKGNEYTDWANVECWNVDFFIFVLFFYFIFYFIVPLTTFHWMYVFRLECLSY